MQCSQYLQTEPDSVDRPYLSVVEVAREYGGSVAFWRKAVLQRKIPYVKLGRLVRISRADLDSYFTSRRVDPLVRGQKGRCSTEAGSDRAVPAKREAGVSS